MRAVCSICGAPLKLIESWNHAFVEMAVQEDGAIDWAEPQLELGDFSARHVMCAASEDHMLDRNVAAAVKEAYDRSAPEGSTRSFKLKPQG